MKNIFGKATLVAWIRDTHVHSHPSLYVEVKAFLCLCSRGCGTNEPSASFAEKRSMDRELHAVPDGEPFVREGSLELNTSSVSVTNSILKVKFFFCAPS